MSAANLVRQMVERGLTHEQALIALEVMEAADEERRAEKRQVNAARQRRHRLSRVTGVTERDERDTPAPLSPPDKEAPEPQEINPPISPHPGGARRRGANPIIVLQSVLDTMASQRWVSHCGDKGRRMSVAQAEELVQTLREVKARGANPNDAVQLAIRKGWVSIDIEYLENAGFLKATTPQQTIDWRSRVSAFQQDGFWPHGWGPKPGEPGCKAPPELIRGAA